MTEETQHLKIMINAYYGITQTPFETQDNLENQLLKHQHKIYIRVREQATMGGFSVIVGEPGTGKTIFKQALLQLPKKRYHILVLNRAIFSWNNFLSLLCEALEVEAKGYGNKLEKIVLSEVRKLNSRGKSIIFIIDDAHLIPADLLKQIRLLLEDFPKNHNLLLIGQLELISLLKKREHEEIHSRITMSDEFKPLSPDDIIAFIYRELDKSGLPHNTFTQEAIHLINKVNHGNLRATKNLCIGGMLEAIRHQTKTVDIKHINLVLDQPHWRSSNRLEGKEPVVFTNQKPKYKDKNLS